MICNWSDPARPLLKSAKQLYDKLRCLDCHNIHLIREIRLNKTPVDDSKIKENKWRKSKKTACNEVNFQVNHFQKKASMKVSTQFPLNTKRGPNINT